MSAGYWCNRRHVEFNEHRRFLRAGFVELTDSGWALGSWRGGLEWMAHVRIPVTEVPHQPQRGASVMTVLIYDRYGNCIVHQLFIWHTNSVEIGGGLSTFGDGWDAHTYKIMCWGEDSWEFVFWLYSKWVQKKNYIDNR